jgi:hypothetical protein
MRYISKTLVIVVTVVFITASLILAQQAPAGQQGARGRGNAAAVPDNRPFDPHDLTGYWYRDQGFRGIRGLKVSDVPEMTELGKKMFDANIPVRGRNKGQPLNGEHPGFVRAVIPALSNDPIMKCDPQGIPRLILDNEPTEWFMAPGRLMQFFQWGHIPREIWLDGRAVPSGDNLDNLGDSWFGMSVGKWDGDTLVVTTVGQRDKSWLDIHGFPHSFNMRLEERYKRVSYDRIQWTFTIYDPEIYKTPWESDVKGFRRMKDEEVTFFGWKGFSGFLEGYCAETEEQEFNDRVRDPAGLGHK